MLVVPSEVASSTRSLLEDVGFVLLLPHLTHEVSSSRNSAPHELHVDAKTLSSFFLAGLCATTDMQVLLVGLWATCTELDGSSFVSFKRTCLLPDDTNALGAHLSNNRRHHNIDLFGNALSPLGEPGSESELSSEFREVSWLAFSNEQCCTFAVSFIHARQRLKPTADRPLTATLRATIASTKSTDVPPSSAPPRFSDALEFAWICSSLSALIFSG